MHPRRHDLRAEPRGVSHAPEECTDWADIEAGANLLLATVLDVAGGD
ncbi:MAG: hypothetical protein M5U09_13775 [Gammaproteobacteria bacterium]|nr:hypothetical protein [Gammaproteobacteria bacterium]